MQALNNNKLAWSLVEQAVAAGASDLHLEPMRDAVRVRIRVDGLLRELVRLPLAAHSTLVTQLKVAANMDIAEKRVPQDGRIALELDGRNIDLRLSTLPTTLGEKIAIRLLSQQELLQLERQEQQLIAKNNELKIEVEQLKGPERIIGLAQQRLGMNVARSNIYVKSGQAAKNSNSMAAKSK